MSKVLEITCRDVGSKKLAPGADAVERINSPITYDDFYTNYLILNKPCIFDAHLTSNWSCLKQWNLDNGAPDLDALSLLFGQCIVPVADCNKKYYNAQEKRDMCMDEYLDYWTRYAEKGYPDSMPLLYLKDWHCKREFPNIPTYTVPEYFQSDWLNEYCLENREACDDYMFVYMGPKGTWTPLHVDVFTSYSWSANVVGKKRWLLFPPGQEEFLRDVHGQLVYDATLPELNDRTKYKAYDARIIKCIEVIQQAGEVMFIPSGWHHQVWNLEDTISVNHNWINACNIGNVWRGLKNELTCVMKEVEDCRDTNDDWPRQCQLILRTSYGMDYIQFLDLIVFIAERRLRMLANRKNGLSLAKIEFGTNHCLFDLDAIRLVLIDFIRETQEKAVSSFVYQNNLPQKLLDRIVSTLQLYRQASNES